MSVFNYYSAMAANMFDIGSTLYSASKCIVVWTSWCYILNEVLVKFFYENLHHTILYVLAVGLIHHLICVVIHALLLCGVATKRYHMLLPWVIYGIFQLSVQFGYTIGFSVFLMTSGDIVFGLLNFFLSLAACATGFYFWLVVYSEFKDIRMLTIQANNSCWLWWWNLQQKEHFSTQWCIIVIVIMYSTMF